MLVGCGVGDEVFDGVILIVGVLLGVTEGVGVGRF